LWRLVFAAGTRCDIACGWRVVFFRRWQGGAELAQQAYELALLCRGQSAEDVPLVGQVLAGGLVDEPAALCSQRDQDTAAVAGIGFAGDMAGCFEPVQPFGRA